MASEAYPACGGAASTADLNDADLAVAARRLLMARQALARHMPGHLGHDPSLDILLTLFLGSVEQREMMADALFDAVSVDRSTMVRWLHALMIDDLVTADASTIQRRSAVRLTGKGLATVRAMIAAVAGSEPTSGSDRTAG